MRQGNPKQRMRGRGNNSNNSNRKGPNPLTRSYESNGPDVKVRGTALHIAEKYVALSRDASASGDRVLAENYMQHAEHYYRIIAAAQAQLQQPITIMRTDIQSEDEDYEDDVDTSADFRPTPAVIEQPQPYVEDLASQPQPVLPERAPYQPREMRDGNRDRDGRERDGRDRDGNRDRFGDRQRHNGSGRPYRDRNDRGPDQRGERGPDMRGERGPDQRGERGPDQRAERGPDMRGERPEGRYERQDRPDRGQQRPYEPRFEDREGRPPRENREPREFRGDREPRENREPRDYREPRAERRPEPAYEPRAERHEQPVIEERAIEPVAAPVVAAPVAVAPVVSAPAVEPVSDLPPFITGAPREAEAPVKKRRPRAAAAAPAAEATPAAAPAAPRTRTRKAVAVEAAPEPTGADD
ncbi:DUF4167 domain-containing protein [Prosthecomicrobium hirschii]